MAQCPAHDDQDPSLSITVIDSRVLVYCHAGCDTAAVLTALNLTMADLFDDRRGTTYVYTDGRRVHRTFDKQWKQSGNTKGKALYQPKAQRDDPCVIANAETVFFPEGEQDCDAIASAGGVAVCSAMGAGNAKRADFALLRDKNVVIIRDKDDPGHEHADDVAERVLPIAKSVTIVEAAVGKDAADHIAAGKSLNDFVEVGKVASLLDTLARSGSWLDAQRFPDLEYAVDRIIPEGAGLLVAPPKKGKSFLVANVGLAVAAGRTALGGIPVEKRPVLYLALEDGHRRLQNRFRRIVGEGEPIPDGIEVVINAAPAEVLQLIADFLSRHAVDKPFVILDTLGKVKPPKRSGEESYLADYEIGSTLKRLVDAVPGSTLLVVHHTRKAEAVDFVDSVSGTQGIAGSFDFVLVLDRKRHSDNAVLSVTGRDVIEAQYALTADEGILWRLDGADLTASCDAVDKLRAAEKLADRSMDVYLKVRAAKGRPVSAVEIAGSLGDMDNDTAGKYLRRLAANGYISKLKRGLYVVSEPSEPFQTDTSATPNNSDTHSDAPDSLSGTLFTVRIHPDRSDGGDTSDTSDTSDTNTPSSDAKVFPPCPKCQQPMSHHDSIERGYCEACRLKAKRLGISITDLAEAST